mmetsp:Transcript_5393/g.6822  ORF Transcript_5393/g.6822 Transcript_5393/m.6822 type:complete len:459 (+) Transcript_5393:52-1428(+)
MIHGSDAVIIMTVRFVYRRRPSSHVLVTICLIIFLLKVLINDKVPGELKFISATYLVKHFRNSKITLQYAVKHDFIEHGEYKRLRSSSKHENYSFGVNMCDIEALSENLVDSKSYGISNSTLSKPHPCRFLRESVRFGEFEELANPADVRQLLVFKSARTGSQMIYNILKQAVQRSDRPSTVRFEPFSRISCYHRNSVETEEVQLKNMLSLNCDIDSDACNPGRLCRKWPFDPKLRHPLTIDLINARFLDRVSWRKIVFSKTTQVFNLRRTNLVSMAYSYFRMKNKKCGRRSRKFSLTALSECVSLYAIPDQEYSSSAALEAVQGLGHSGLLLLYEDFMKYQDLMEQPIFHSLNVHTGKLGVSSTIHKVHKKGTICQYADVDCRTLRIGLEMLNSACLLKQLDESGNPHVAWSMPIDGNNKISSRGNCHPLGPLRDPVTNQLRVRRLEELYVYTNANN